MLNYFLTDEVRTQFRKRSLIAGTLFAIAGVFSIIAPAVTSFTLSFLLGFLFILGSVISGYHVKQSYNKSWLAWFKPVILFIIGVLIFRHPITGVAAIGLILMIYFFFDGFASIFFALEFRPITGWFWMFLNGIISIVIALIFLFGWPISSVWLIGLLVGISLLSDGIALIMLGLSVPKHDF
jgi:uncharacterized membrane protein HdeD (DUF308 family)